MGNCVAINSYMSILFNVIDNVFTGEIDEMNAEKMVETIRKNAKIMESLTKELRKTDERLESENRLLDENIPTNMTLDAVSFDLDSLSKSELDSLNADVTEMEKIKNVGRLII